MGRERKWCGGRLERKLTRVTASKGIGAVEGGGCPDPRIGRGKAGGSRIAGHVAGCKGLPDMLRVSRSNDPNRVIGRVCEHSKLG